MTKPKTWSQEVSKAVMKGYVMNAADPRAMLDFLEVDSAQLLTAAGEHPEFLELEVCLDSGAGDHELAKMDVPGYAIEPSPGSLAGLHSVAAGGKRIPV